MRKIFTYMIMAIIIVISSTGCEKAHKNTSEILEQKSITSTQKVENVNKDATSEPTKAEEKTKSVQNEATSDVSKTTSTNTNTNSGGQSSVKKNSNTISTPKPQPSSKPQPAPSPKINVPVGKYQSLTDELNSMIAYNCFGLTKIVSFYESILLQFEKGEINEAQVKSQIESKDNFVDTITEKDIPNDGTAIYLSPQCYPIKFITSKQTAKEIFVDMINKRIYRGNHYAKYAVYHNADGTNTVIGVTVNLLVTFPPK